VTAHAFIVGYVIVARLAELMLSRRNTRRLLAKGAVEVGQKHYPLLVVIHIGWMVALVFLVPTETPPVPALLTLFVILQIVRYWVIWSLGERWTTKIVVLPQATLVKRGPYRWFRHPNYLVVVLEIAVVPLMFGAWGVALAFSLVNAALLRHRILIEERALGLRAA